MADKKIVETIKDLEEFFEMCGKTAQITYRVRKRPRWLVRITRSPQDDDLVFRQAVDDDLGTAIEACFEAWTRDEEAEAAGRRGEE